MRVTVTCKSPKIHKAAGFSFFSFWFTDMFVSVLDLLLSWFRLLLHFRRPTLRSRRLWLVVLRLLLEAGEDGAAVTDGEDCGSVVVEATTKMRTTIEQGG
ncbi:hypothetical protein Peur_000798 [Populus x canadensis]